MGLWVGDELCMWEKASGRVVRHVWMLGRAAGSSSSSAGNNALPPWPPVAFRPAPLVHPYEGLTLLAPSHPCAPSSLPQALRFLTELPSGRDARLLLLPNPPALEPTHADAAPAGAAASGPSGPLLSAPTMLELVVHAALQQLPGGEGTGQGAKAASRTAVGGRRAGHFG